MGYFLGTFLQYMDSIRSRCFMQWQILQQLKDAFGTCEVGAGGSLFLNFPFSSGSEPVPSLANAGLYCSLRASAFSPAELISFLPSQCAAIPIKSWRLLGIFWDWYEVSRRLWLIDDHVQLSSDFLDSFPQWTVTFPAIMSICWFACLKHCFHHLNLGLPGKSKSTPVNYCHCVFSLQAFQELQIKMVETSQQLRINDLQVEKLKRQQQHAKLTGMEIKGLPEGTNVYEGIGRMWVSTMSVEGSIWFRGDVA